jgi:diguanylate cyclase (GGDEF)-like protein
MKFNLSIAIMKVLIADDDKVLRMLMERQLEGWGFEVMTAQDGEEAFEILTTQAEPPRMLVLDWEMPNLDGIELCRKIRALESNDPPYIVLVTAHSDQEHLATALHAGANDYISKPTKPVELRARLGVGLRTLELQNRLNIANEMLAYKAEHDELTGLQNRASLIEHLDNEIERTKRTGEPLALASCDIDFFKRINDTYGHPVGDRVLKEFADRMKETFRPYDLVSRYGGEEFVVCCTALETEPKAIFERFREVIESTPFLESDLSLGITVSVGVATFDGISSMTSKEIMLGLISDSDKALYAAKHSGRNQVVMFDPIRHSVSDKFEEPLIDGQIC